ncbi:MAG: TfoX/Sxy family protein [Muribaculaceae bacterium]|nr:TfoX/Sxy family protein [Muribaculaceae bacterium]
MACSAEYIRRITELLSPLGEVRTRKMMGDYVLYLDNKCILTLCDNTSYIKKAPPLKDILANCPTGYPYPDAKEYYILDNQPMQLIHDAVSTLWHSLPEPRKK